MAGTPSLRRSTTARKRSPSRRGAAPALVPVGMFERAARPAAPGRPGLPRRRAGSTREARSQGNGRGAVISLEGHFREAAQLAAVQLVDACTAQDLERA